MIAGLALWRYQEPLKEAVYWLGAGHALTVAKELALKPKNTFKECTDCPEVIVVPAGNFTMGSPETEERRAINEGPQHGVTIAKPFAVSKFDVTFDEWDACATHGDCDPHIKDSGMGRGQQPVINVSWDDAQTYVAWLGRVTGKPYRLLTETEWEYAARAGSTTAYYWGDEIGKGNANCIGCDRQWEHKQTSPVGSFKPNAFGLYDMAGNVYQWVQDCYHDFYNGAPTDRSEWTGADCRNRVIRGGSWNSIPEYLRSASRTEDPNGGRYGILGFRVGRTLTP
jgi:formylglycine-generating enzyme required for sulfatase activity